LCGCRRGKVLSQNPKLEKCIVMQYVLMDLVSARGSPTDLSISKTIRDLYRAKNPRNKLNTRKTEKRTNAATCTTETWHQVDVGTE
jgi:hypothetical protein